MKPADAAEERRIVLGLLRAADDGRLHSQRHAAQELGIAVGLVNAYVRKCVRKGLLKVSEVPARRYAYYVTPQGFAEKARLTAEYLTSAFSLFRHTRADCTACLHTARTRGFRTIAFAGVSEVAEIAALCAIEADIRVVGLVDPDFSMDRYVGLAVSTDFDRLAEAPDGVLVTSIGAGLRLRETAERRYGADRVLVPDVLAPALKVPVDG